MIKNKRLGWAIKWRSENQLDGKTEYFCGERWRQFPPETLRGYGPAVFATRREARRFVQNNYGYIKHRPDLLAEPHGWKMPQVVRVEVVVSEVSR